MHEKKEKVILVVDDEPMNIKMTTRVLGKVPEYKAEGVLSGQAALEYLENNKVDLVLLDIEMPEMNGFQVLESIKSNENIANIPVIFLTGNSDAKTESNCLQAGAADYITKPFVPMVVLSRVEKTLELEEYHQALAKELEEKTQEVDDIKSKSQKDALTGLWNRSYTQTQATASMLNGEKGVLFMCDLDNFKLINDHYGHIAGDNTLKIVAEAMKRHCAETDIVCRIGGDEFVAYITSTVNKREVARIANNIIVEVVKEIEALNYDTNTSISIGIAQFPEDGEDFNSLYNAGDKALYHVKQNGKNSYHFYSEQKNLDSERTSNLVDLKYLKEIMLRMDANNGAYQLEYDNFHHIYNLIRRFAERGSKEVSTLLFTAHMTNYENDDAQEMETALAMLEKAVFVSLRRVDVSTRYSSKQLVVLLMDSSVENSSKVGERILDCYQKLYIGGKVKFDYEIAKVGDK